MNPQNLSLEWQKAIRELARVAGQLECGEIVIKVLDRKPVLTEYTVKRKMTDVGDFMVRAIEDI
jgi:hypothetical protein